MIILISPAKTLDLNATDIKVRTDPEFKKEVKEIVGVMKKKPKAEIQKLMDVSENIAVLNKERYKNFEDQFTPENSKPALFAFKGDVYRKMEVDNYSKGQLEFAQEHLRILSGLYGLLRPLDLIQPYRLEMGLKLKIKRANNLYSYWGNKITEAIDAAAIDGMVINLASKEYFKAVNQKKLQSKVIHIIFKEYRDGSYKTVGIFAKQARGMMANYIIEHQISDPQKLKLFNQEKYEYAEKLSSEKEWVFIR